MLNSKTILVGDSWSNFDSYELSKLLINAGKLRISSIDTAPSYGTSEFLSGKCSE